MKFLYILIIILCTTSVSSIYSQDSNNYFVFTFYVTQNKGEHKTSKYYWIIEKDSLFNTSKQLSPLYIEDFSASDIVDCQNKEETSPFVVFKGEKFNFSKKYLEMQKSLPKIIELNRRKVFTINKKFVGGYKEKIRVYITLVNGVFCNSKMDVETAQMINFYGNVYLPIKNITSASFSDFEKLNLYNIQSKINLSIVNNIPWR